MSRACLHGYAGVIVQREHADFVHVGSERCVLKERIAGLVRFDAIEYHVQFFAEIVTRKIRDDFKNGIHNE